MRVITFYLLMYCYVANKEYNGFKVNRLLHITATFDFLMLITFQRDELYINVAKL